MKLLALDIGGVLASIDKSELNFLCLKAQLSLQDIFNADFWRLQKGLISAEKFVATMSAKLNISRESFKNIFISMLRVGEVKDFFENIALPYIFFSNINELHYGYFLKQIKASPFAINNSIVSFEQKQLKPHPRFFQQLGKILPVDRDEIMLIDDQVINIEAAKKYGFRAQLFKGKFLSSLLKSDELFFRDI